MVPSVSDAKPKSTSETHFLPAPDVVACGKVCRHLSPLVSRFHRPLTVLGALTAFFKSKKSATQSKDSADLLGKLCFDNTLILM